MLPEKIARNYPTEEAYDKALRHFCREVPDQEEMPGDPKDRARMIDNAPWWPCSCKLPWWGFRRGAWHLVVRPEDGQHLPYEYCPNSPEYAKHLKAKRERDRKESKYRV